MRVRWIMIPHLICMLIMDNMLINAHSLDHGPHAKLNIKNLKITKGVTALGVRVDDALVKHQTVFLVLGGQL